MLAAAGGGGSSDEPGEGESGTGQGRPKHTSSDTESHVHNGGIETDPTSPYRGKWDGKGIHDWDGLQKAVDRDGYTIKSVAEDPASGTRRVEVERVGTDPRTGAEVRGTVKKTIYPREMTPRDIDVAGDQALQDALASKPGSKLEPYGTKLRTDGTPADGYFESTVPGPEGKPVRVQGWFKQNPDGSTTISSHAPRFDKNWPQVPPGGW